MKRLAFVGWLVGSIGLWFALVLCTNNLIISRIWYKIPMGFYEVTNDGFLFAVRLFKPSYDPGVLQMADSGILVLLIATCLISAAIIIPVSIFAWRRILSSRLW